MLDQRELVFAALNWEDPEVVPFVPKINHAPRDPARLNRLKKMGMGLSVGVNVCKVESPNVSIEEKIVDDHRITIFHTPVGDVSEKRRINLPNEGGERSDSWIVEHMFKGPEDYKTVKFIVEDKVYRPDYIIALQKIVELDSEGVVFTEFGYDPLMQVIINYMGFQRFAIEINRRPRQVEELMEAIDPKVKEICRIVANSPVKLTAISGNIDSMLISPNLFKRYILPYYQDYAEILHRGDKIAMSHLDGRLRSLKELIRETGLDVVEAFTPPPGGDLSLKEARVAWGKEIAIWVNVPEVTFYYEPPELERFIRELLAEASPGNGLVIGITETVPPSRRDDGLEIITKTVKKYGRYPIPPS